MNVLILLIFKSPIDSYYKIFIFTYITLLTNHQVKHLHNSVTKIEIIIIDSCTSLNNIN